MVEGSYHQAATDPDMLDGVVRVSTNEVELYLALGWRLCRDSDDAVEMLPPRLSGAS